MAHVRSVNTVHLVGRLTKDAQIRVSTKGDHFANFTVATSEIYPGWEKPASYFHRVCMAGKQVENIGKYLTKGIMVAIIGSLRTRKWKDAQGNTRWITEVFCQQLIFLSVKEQTREAEEGPGGSDEEATSERMPGDDDPFA